VTDAPALASGELWLVRHAATTWTGVRWCGRADPPLSAAGIADARRLARDLAERLTPGATVLSSPARRARRTAAEIAPALGSAVTIDDRLVEVDVGRLEGLTWDEVLEREPATARAIEAGTDVDWPGGESAADVAARAADVAAAIERARGGSLVVVSHGVFLHALARHLGATDATPLGPAGALRLG